MTTLAPTLEAYFTDRLLCQRRVSPNTVASYRDAWRPLLAFVQQTTGIAPSRLELTQLDAPTIGAFLTHLEQRRGNSPRTRNIRLAAVHSFFQYCALRHPEHAALIQRVLAIPTKRGEKRTVTFLTPNEVQALLNAPDRTTWAGRRDHALLLTAVQTGLRVSEVLALTRADTQLGTGAHVRTIGKGRKERVAPLTSQTVAVLKVWMRESGVDLKSPLFPSRDGGPLTRDAIERRLAKHVATARRTCPTARSKRITMHVLRHTAAMTLLNAGVDTSTIALWLGHEQERTTHVYLHADLELKQRTLDRITPPTGHPGRYRAPDSIIAFLDDLWTARGSRHGEYACLGRYDQLLGGDPSANTEGLGSPTASPDFVVVRHLAAQSRRWRGPSVGRQQVAGQRKFRPAGSFSGYLARPNTEDGACLTMERMGDAPPDSQSIVPGRPGIDALIAHAARGYVDAICIGDADAAAALIDDALDCGVSPVELHSRVIAPAMRAVGVLWEGCGMSVAEEHLATAISYQTLTRLYPALLSQAKRRGDAVVVAGAAGDHHLLALRMVADVFEGAGFTVLFAGADVPQEVLLALVAEHQPAIVALGITMPLNAAALARELLALRAHDPQLRLVVGGQGVPEALRECDGVFYAADTEQLAEYAGRVMTGPLQGELPLDIAEGGVVVAGNFEDREPEVGGGLEARFAQAAAVFADAARGNARRVFALEQIAFRDPLTDLWNRRAFEDRIQALSEGSDVQHPALVMIDVDHFKAINDGYGHRAGDLALIGVARCITDSIRPNDFAARFGGDEFVVLLPSTPTAAAVEIGERIRRQIETTLTAPQITVSIGISVPDHSDRRLAALDVDRALYAAKEHGRNQLAVA